MFSEILSDAQLWPWSIILKYIDVRMHASILCIRALRKRILWRDILIKVYVNHPQASTLIFVAYRCTLRFSCSTSIINYRNVISRDLCCHERRNFSHTFAKDEERKGRSAISPLISKAREIYAGSRSFAREREISRKDTEGNLYTPPEWMLRKDTGRV